MLGKLKEAYLIIGLGNPGKRYVNTYHNVGAALVRELATGLDWEESDQLFDTVLLPSKVRCLLPATFMNESGEAVVAALKKYRLSPNNILVIHDDSDLAIGSYKLSFGRSSAGHRGVQSIINTLQTKDFHRLRIGVRTKIGKASDFVLKKIPPSEKKILQGVFAEVKETVIEKE